MRRWGNELAVYDGCNAQTHVLKGLSADLLTVFHSCPEEMTLDQLAVQFFADDAEQPPEVDSYDRVELERLLEGLLNLALVRCTGSQSGAKS